MANSELRSFINENPKLSGNKIYEKIKGTDLAIRKKDFYKVYRQERKIRIKPKSERESNIPKIYREKELKIKKQKDKMKEPKIELPEVPEGTYKVAKLVNSKTGNTYYIKFSTDKAFNKQLSKLIAKGYANKVTDFKMKISKSKNYKSFIAPEFDLSLLDF